MNEETAQRRKCVQDVEEDPREMRVRNGSIAITNPYPFKTRAILNFAICSQYIQHLKPN